MWSDKQQNILKLATGLAGWNDQQRYMAMRACGCPLIKGTTGRGQATQTGVMRPSIKSPGNSHEQFAAVMALAESAAAQRGTGGSFPKPGNADTWAAASFDTSSRTRDLARRIWAEAVERMPGVFVRDPAALDTFVSNQLSKDPSEFPGLFDAAPVCLDECDLAQCLRIVESLKAWVGRKFYEGGLTPRSFYTPKSAIAQANAQARRHIAKREEVPS